MVKNLPAMQKTWVQSLGWKHPPEGHGNPLQYSCLENPMDSETWQATIRSVAESDMIERLNFHFLFSLLSRSNHL